MRTDTWIAGTATALAPTQPRRGRKALVIVVALVVLAGGVSVGAIFGSRNRDAHWRPLYTQAMQRVTRLESSSQTWLEASRQYRSQLRTLQTSISSSVGDLNNPHFVLWNSCGAAGPEAGCALTPGHEYIGGVPDTFTYYVRFRSTVPVTVTILSTQDFICWETGKCGSQWNASGLDLQWSNLTSLQDGVFHGAEGCAGYFAVFASKKAGILYPDVSITRNPAADATGACA